MKKQYRVKKSNEIESILDKECKNEEEHFFRRLVLMKATEVSIKEDSLDIKNL